MCDIIEREVLCGIGDSWEVGDVSVEYDTLKERFNIFGFVGIEFRRNMQI